MRAIRTKRGTVRIPTLTWYAKQVFHQALSSGQALELINEPCIPLWPGDDSTAVGVFVVRSEP